MNIRLKKNRLLFLAVVLLNGCVPANNEDLPAPPVETDAKLLFKASNEVPDWRSGGDSDANIETIIFTGNDILWFNETTEEIRFNNNITLINNISTIPHKTIKSYLDDDYLFSSMTCISEIDNRIFDNLVLYYSKIENRIYLKTGYPDVSVLKYPEKHQELREKNRAKIEKEWNIFIEQLKSEERYVK